MKEQVIFRGKESHKHIKGILNEYKIKKVMLVCDQSLDSLPIKPFLDCMTVPYVRFSDFIPNPMYNSVVKGIELFHKEGCDFILAVGGGSTIDIAKCIKLFLNQDSTMNYLDQKIIPNDIKILAMPTTAGTGSESTKFAVVYKEGEKQSINHESIIPDFVLLDPGVLKTLPAFQKKSTMLDALCQAIESMWSVHSTEKSKALSGQAISMIMESKKDYLSNKSDGNEKMMVAANIAGQAINITQTTAAHAMSYKITSLFEIPHGQAVALCLPKVWNYMALNMDKCVDARGAVYLKDIFMEIARCLGSDSIKKAIQIFEDLIADMGMAQTIAIKDEQLNILVNSVNPNRLNNNPVKLDAGTLKNLYHEIFATKTYCVPH